jgi:aspartyl-tRNA(Asn)/glutamyl-tRNA(Gln) amidotransferase subunit A
MISRRVFVGACSAAILRADPADLAVMTLAEASARVRKKTVSPVELTQACLKRIERLNPKLNAYITVTGETALAQARALEAEAQRGHWRGPLHGIPIALKDNIDTAGVRTTAASELFKDRVPPEDAEVVVRLKKAGGVILGKTNLHEFALGGSGAVSYFGAVHNPWALDRISGGSSAGSAAATATGLCFGSLGTDTAGSVRIPASYCGIVGFKPTYGRVSNRGTVPDAWTLDHIGPLCRTVEDAALVLGAIAGYDELDPSSVDTPVPDYGRAFRMQASKLRAGVPRVPYFDGLDPEIDKSVAAAIEVLRKLAASVQDIATPLAPVSLTEVWTKVCGAESYAYHAKWLAESPEKYQPYTRERLAGPRNAGGPTQDSRDMKASAYLEGRRQLDILRREIRKAFATVDLLVLPTMPSSPVPITQGAEPTAVSIRNTCPFDVLGLPVISIPCGFTNSGLPIGLQIVGAPFAESTVLALAHAYEQATDWHRRSPSL